MNPDNRDRRTGKYIALVISVTLALVPFVLLAGFFDAVPAAGDESMHWKSYSEALRDAKTSKRKVLIDVYTTWCGWCKKMDRDVYADSAVIRELGERFEIAKLNAESASTHEIDGSSYSEKAIAQGYGVTGYPTTLFLTDSGEAITVVPGYIPKQTFLRILEYVGTESYKSVSWKDFQAAKDKP